MYFNGGDDFRSLVVEDEDRIKLLDHYLATHQNPFFFKAEIF